MSGDWQSHARARPVYLTARRAGVHARCFGLTSLDVLHVDVFVCRHKTTSEMTTSADDDERDEQDEQDEREEVPDERVRVRVQELRDQETKSRSKNPQKPLELKSPKRYAAPSGTRTS